MMQQENRSSEDLLMEREEKCRKARKSVSKAIFMRLFVTGLLLWVLFQTAMELWVLGLMAFVLLINVSGLLPLVTELRKRNRELKEIMDQYE